MNTMNYSFLTNLVTWYSYPPTQTFLGLSRVPPPPRREEHVTSLKTSAWEAMVQRKYNDKGCVSKKNHRNFDWRGDSVNSEKKWRRCFRRCLNAVFKPLKLRLLILFTIKISRNTMNYILVSSTAAQSGQQRVFFCGPTYIDYHAENNAVPLLDAQLKGAVSPNLVLLKNPMNVSVLIGNQLVVA